MHKATISVVDADSVQMQMTIRASVGTLRKVRAILHDELSQSYDHNVNEFLNAIRKSVDAVDADFVGLGTSEETP